MRLQARLFLIFTMTFVVVLIISGFLSYRQSLSQQYAQIQDEAAVLAAALRSVSHVYQDEFANQDILIDDKTHGLVPEHAMSSISRQFLQQVEGGLTFNNVSDHPRNPTNRADSVEQKALEHFRRDSTAKTFIEPFVSDTGEGYFLYAEPLRLEQQCMGCHGISSEQVTAAETEGATRQLHGVLSIKIPLERVEQLVKRQQVTDFLYYLVMLASLIVPLFFFVRLMVVRRLESLQRQLQVFGEGNLETRASVQGSDELTALARTFNEMADKLGSSQAQLNMLAVAIEQSPVTVIITDTEGHIQHVNPKFTQITGYSLDEIKGKTPRVFKSGHTSRNEYGQLWQTIKSGNVWRGEFVNRKKNGEEFWERATISPAFDSQGRIQHFIAVKEDVSELKQFEKTLELQTYYDSLTGLPNRALFSEQLGLHLERGLVFAVAVINLDGFQKVNISRGLVGGDAVIRETAQRLKRLLRPVDILARLTADEFAVLLPGRSMADTYATFQRVLEVLSHAFEVDRQKVFISASIGAALAPDDGAGIEELRRNVLSALHRAKEAGGGQLCFFQPDLGERLLEQFSREGELRQALERDEFELYYQPQMCGGKVQGGEALLRWHSGKFGFVSPADFIPLAEQSGLIVQIGRWVLETACRQASNWPEEISVSVNVSSRQFAEGNLVAVVQEALASSGLAAHRLEIEVTESLMQENLESTAQTLQELAGLGVHIALDDFGTGYASLSYLSSLPFSVLKLDRSFIENIEHCERDQNLCQAIVRIADALGLRMIAEGVEEQAQQELLQQWGVRWFQGYYYSRPLQEGSFLEYVARSVARTEHDPSGENL